MRRRAMTAIELETRYSAPNYAPLPVVLTRGEGAYLWDTAGRRYVDMMSAYSAASHGHAHPRILAVLTAQAKRLAVPSRAYYSDRLGPFLEVQSGLGRTGAWFAYEHEGIRPDGVILGKALGGGMLPVSAFVARREVMDVFTPGSHGSTFGGNPLAAAISLEALHVIRDEGLV